EGEGRPEAKAAKVAALAFEDLQSVAGADGRGFSAGAVAAACRAALDRIESAFIGTIHGFCADLLRRHPLAAGVDPYFRVDDGLAWRRFHEEQWPVFL